MNHGLIKRSWTMNVVLIVEQQSEALPTLLDITQIFEKAGFEFMTPLDKSGVMVLRIK